MLSERQKQFIVEKVNADVDLPLMSEGMEEKIIRRLVNKVESVLEPALRVLISEDYVGCIKVALDENLEVDGKSERISNVMRGNLSEPFSRNLDERVSCMLPKKMEAYLFRKVANKIIDASVEWTVGKVDSQLQSMALSREAPRDSMLNERQRHVAITRLNEEIDIPLLSEKREERMIEKMFDRVMPQVEPSLNRIMPEVWINCIKLALNEHLHIKERRDQISRLVRGELSEPLSREINERVDIKFIPEKIEGKVLKILTNKIIEEIVEWTVGNIDDKFK
ncbi:unnamed protein product [Ascophyllum nodosum]